MITSIVFDIGKVLFDYQPIKIVQNLLPHRTDHDFFVKELHDHDVWQHLDNGILTPEEAIILVNSKHPDDIQHEIKHILDNFIYELDPINEVIALFKQFSQSHNTYLLSNFQADPFMNLKKHYPFLNESKGYVVSGIEKVMKPDPTIYRLLLDRFNLNPAETLFIDDRVENIDAAKKLGISGIVYTSPAQLNKEITIFVKTNRNLNS